MPEPPNGEKATQKSPPRATLQPGTTGVWTGARQPPQKGARKQIGRFEVRKLLGEGAFAFVYLAFDPDLEREVAIKVPKAEELTPEARDLFLRENRLAAIIQHPNICPVYEVGTDENLPYIVMRVVPNTLAGLLRRLNGTMPARTAVTVVRKLALGLVAAHAQKVIHRDLKPANILYDDVQREVMIADFGLARFADQGSASSKGVPKGTPAYMAPEQALGRVDEIGPASDIYGLGVILYEMLAGRMPFTGSAWEVMRDHCETAPVPPSRVRPGTDPRLDAIVLKAMAKAPVDRYPTAKEFANALAEFLRGGEDPGAVNVVLAEEDRAPGPRGAPPAAPTESVIQTLPLPRTRPAEPRAVPPAPDQPLLPLPAPRRASPRAGPGASRTLVWIIVGLLLFVVFGLAVFLSNRTPNATQSSTPTSRDLKTPAPKAPPSKGSDPKLPTTPRVTEASQLAVKSGLAWLARQQAAAGGWTFDRGGFKEDRVAATGMALRPFLWASDPSKKAAEKDEDDRNSDRVIAKGLGFLTKACPVVGPDAGKMSGNVYAQAIGTIALCEGYGMTRDPAVKPHAQAAINYIQQAQGPNGSWGYTPGTNGDTSVVGWQIQALQAAKLTKELTVDERVFKKAVGFLDFAAAGPRKAMYGYQDNAKAAPGTALTAIGLLCRYRIDGWGPTHPGMIDGVAGLAKNGPPGTGNVRDLYYFFFATQVVRRSGGADWSNWSEGPKGADGTRKGGMRDWLVGEQVTKAGADFGSWEPETGEFGEHCGRLGTTAVCLLVLQMCDGEAGKE